MQHFKTLSKTFPIKITTFIHDYMVKDNILKRVNKMKYLSVIMDQRLYFKNHIQKKIILYYLQISVF